MRLCISSVVTTVLLISAVIVLCCPLLRSETFLRFAGTRWVKVLFGCILVRIFLPMEFPYTYSFRFTEIFTTVRTILTRPLIQGNDTLKFYHILLAVWIAGIGLEVWRNGKFYRKTREAVFLFEREPEEGLLSEAKKLWTEYPELRKTRIKICAFVDSPLLIGVRHFVILLPEERYTAEELRYILGHEALHMRGRDTLWKMLIDLVCIVWWWNPLFYWLRRELFRVIEINNDLRMTNRMTVEERADYMECLCKVARNSISQKHFGAVAFSSKGGRELQERFRFITSGITGKKWVQRLVCVLVVAGMFGTTCVIFEPRFANPKEDMPLTKDNTYIVEENGEYKVYVDGNYFFTSDTLDYLPKGAPIYREDKTG